MKRGIFRNLWLLVSLILLSSAWFLYQKGQDSGQEAEQARFTISQLQMERNSQQILANQLNELDSLTLDERNATRLDILRHLDLQATGYDLRINQRQGEEAGGATMYKREFTLKTILPYAQALALADKLHNNPKVVMHTYKLERVSLSDPVTGDAIKIEMQGTLYGLEKQ